jgi:TonB family protein
VVLAWLAYALAVALALAAAAAAAERGLRLRGRPTRWAWLVAMVLSVGLPAAHLAAPLVGGLPTPGVVPSGWASAALAGPVAGTDVEAGGPVGTVVPLEAWFPWLWAGLSAAVLAWLAISAWRLRRICRSCPVKRTGGDVVVWTSGLGPGVIGLRRPRIVVPGWVRQMDADSRRMVFLHEREHVRRGDPHLLHLGWGLVALVPWLVPLWWQFRRLRMAVELDCDQRVVRDVGDPTAYGRLLLEAKRRSLGLDLPLVTAASSFLGRRVRLLAERTARPSGSAPRLALSACVCVLALAGAGLLPPPEDPSSTSMPDDARSATAASAGDREEEDLFERLARPYEEPPEVLNRGEVRASLRAHHPEELRRQGVGGEVLVIVHVSADGRVTGGFLSAGTDHAALDRAALEVASVIRYAPARREGEPLAVWIAQPLRFPVE